METILPSVVVNSNHIDLAISVWLDSKHNKSGSERTLDQYRKTLTKFRALLQSVGRDLDPYTNITGEMTEETKQNACDEITLAAQGFAHLSETGKTISRSTYNNRLAILSSFYTFANKRRFFRCGNPIKDIERAKHQEYKNVVPLPESEVASKMKAIDRSTLIGARDYAMLSIFFQTGRRLAEVVNLTWQDVQIASGIVTLTFQCKGDKVLRDTLPLPISKAFLSWLTMAYGTLDLSPETPLWFSFRRRSRKRIGLTARSVSDILKRRIGVTKVHMTRHTWARTMEGKGAKVSEIQARLGHESMATTGRYLAALRSAENTHALEIAQAFGLDE